MNRPSLDLLRDKKELVGAEIGVQSGVNAKWMLENLDIKKLYLIDPYKEYPSNNKEQTIIGPFTEGKAKAEKALKGYEDKIEWIYKYSWDVLGEFLNGQFDFVYVDGDHREEAVLKDLQYANKIALGGLLCGHDWRFGSVKAAIQTFSDQTRIEFSCCNKTQYVKTMDKHAEGSDWWMHMPEKNSSYIVKCIQCQNKFAFTLENLEWLK